MLFECILFLFCPIRINNRDFVDGENRNDVFSMTFGDSYVTFSTVTIIFTHIASILPPISIVLTHLIVYIIPLSNADNEDNEGGDSQKAFISLIGTIF